MCVTKQRSSLGPDLVHDLGRLFMVSHTALGTLASAEGEKSVEGVLALELRVELNRFR